MSQLEYRLEMALAELDESDMSQEDIDIIRHGCGKPRQTIGDANNEMLDSMFNDFDKIFCKGLSAPVSQKI